MFSQCAEVSPGLYSGCVHEDADGIVTRPGVVKISLNPAETEAYSLMYDNVYREATGDHLRAEFKAVWPDYTLSGDDPMIERILPDDSCDGTTECWNFIPEYSCASRGWEAITTAEECHTAANALELPKNKKHLYPRPGDDPLPGAQAYYMPESMLTYGYNLTRAQISDRIQSSIGYQTSDIPGLDTESLYAGYFKIAGTPGDKDYHPFCSFITRINLPGGLDKNNADKSSNSLDYKHCGIVPTFRGMHAAKGEKIQKRFDNYETQFSLKNHHKTISGWEMDYEFTACGKSTTDPGKDGIMPDPGTATAIIPRDAVWRVMFNPNQSALDIGPIVVTNPDVYNPPYNSDKYALFPQYRKQICKRKIATTCTGGFFLASGGSCHTRSDAFVTGYIPTRAMCVAAVDAVTTFKAVSGEKHSVVHAISDPRSPRGCFATFGRGARAGRANATHPDFEIRPSTSPFAGLPYALEEQKVHLDAQPVMPEQYFFNTAESYEYTGGPAKASICTCTTNTEPVANRTKGMVIMPIGPMAGFADSPGEINEVWTGAPAFMPPGSTVEDLMRHHIINVSNANALLYNQPKTGVEIPVLPDATAVGTNGSISKQIHGAFLWNYSKYGESRQCARFAAGLTRTAVLCPDDYLVKTLRPVRIEVGASASRIKTAGTPHILGASCQPRHTNYGPEAASIQSLLGGNEMSAQKFTDDYTPPFFRHRTVATSAPTCGSSLAIFDGFEYQCPHMHSAGVLHAHTSDQRDSANTIDIKDRVCRPHTLNTPPLTHVYTPGTYHFTGIGMVNHASGLDPEDYGYNNKESVPLTDTQCNDRCSVYGRGGGKVDALAPLTQCHCTGVGATGVSTVKLLGGDYPSAARVLHGNTITKAAVAVFGELVPKDNKPRAFRACVRLAFTSTPAGMGLWLWLTNTTYYVGAFGINKIMVTTSSITIIPAGTAESTTVLDLSNTTITQFQILDGYIAPPVRIRGPFHLEVAVALNQSIAFLPGDDYLSAIGALPPIAPKPATMLGGSFSATASGVLDAFDTNTRVLFGNRTLVAATGSLDGTMVVALQVTPREALDKGNSCGGLLCDFGEQSCRRYNCSDTQFVNNSSDTAFTPFHNAVYCNGDIVPGYCTSSSAPDDGFYDRAPGVFIRARSAWDLDKSNANYTLTRQPTLEACRTQAKHSASDETVFFNYNRISPKACEYGTRVLPTVRPTGTYVTPPMRSVTQFGPTAAGFVVAPNIFISQFAGNRFVDLYGPINKYVHAVAISPANEALQIIVALDARGGNINIVSFLGGVTNYFEFPLDNSNNWVGYNANIPQICEGSSSTCYCWKDNSMTSQCDTDLQNEISTNTKSVRVFDDTECENQCLSSMGPYEMQGTSRTTNETNHWNYAGYSDCMHGSMLFTDQSDGLTLEPCVPGIHYTRLPPANCILLENGFYGKLADTACPRTIAQPALAAMTDEIQWGAFVKITMPDNSAVQVVVDKAWDRVPANPLMGERAHLKRSPPQTYQLNCTTALIN